MIPFTHRPPSRTPAWRQPLRPIKVGRTSLRPAPAPRPHHVGYFSSSPLTLPVLVLSVSRPLLPLLLCPKPRLPACVKVAILWPITEPAACRCTGISKTNQCAMLRYVLTVGYNQRPHMDTAAVSSSAEQEPLRCNPRGVSHPQVPDGSGNPDVR